MRDSRKLPQALGTLTALALTSALVACGGGSDGGSSTGSTGPTTQLSGVAAVGAPLTNATITVYDKTGAKKTATTNSDGVYTVDVSGMTAPLLVVAQGSGYKLLSLVAEISGSQITGNVNELTDWISSEVAIALGKKGALDLLATGSTTGITADTIKTKTSALRTAILDALATAGISDTTGFDPVSTAMKADGTGIDWLLDLITFARDSNGKTVLTSNGSAVTTDAPMSIPADVPLSPQVPTLAYDDSSITLVWKKPASYANVTDYNVYANGKLLGKASENNAVAGNSKAKAYIDQFYKDDSANFHTKITYHNFTATGLTPNTEYKFTVRAIKTVDSKTTESVDSVAVKQTTAPAFTNIYNVATLGAKGDDSTVNTTIIQKAIDECSAKSTSAYGCKVLIPADASTGKVFVTGALFLKSNMTLEIADGATLKGSSDTADYPLSKGYQIYSYFTNSTDDRRPPSLLNLLSEDHRNGTTALANHNGYSEERGVFTNVRVVGKGTLDGNGWAKTTAASITDETGATLPQYVGGSGGTIDGFASGILAKSQMEAALKEYGIDSTNQTAKKSDISNLYSNRRSSLTTFRGVKNMYFGGLTLLNPAYHGVMFIESENMVFANTSSQTFDVNNGDGVEFGNSDGALVYNNFFDTGDDNVNFAAGQGKNYVNGHPSQNFWIFNNYMREGHGVVALGSHTGAWIQDMLAEDNVAFLTDNGLRMKSTPATGGGARRIVFRDNAMRSIGTSGNTGIPAGSLTFADRGSTGNPFVFTLSYSAGSNVFENAAASAQFKDITVKNVTLDNFSTSKGKATIQVDAFAGPSANDASLSYPETFHENITFDTVKIKNAKATSISRLKNSTFKDVTITSDSGTVDSTWWVISNSTGNTFTNVSPVTP
ncbi:MAG: pehB [Proteobacteria bacterium]|nr:pehB [Pseudomonadota bacterium]